MSERKTDERKCSRKQREKNKLKDKFDMMGNVKRDSRRQQTELTMEWMIWIEDTIKIKEFALAFYVHIDVECCKYI